MAEPINITRYNAKNWTVMINDVYLTGLGEDMFSVSKTEDFISRSTGGHGDVVKSVVNDNLGEAELSLQFTSPQLKMCIDLANEQATFSFWAINATRKMRVGGTSASFINYPEITAGAEHEDLSFTIGIDDYSIVMD